MYEKYQEKFFTKRKQDDLINLIMLDRQSKEQKILDK